MGEKNKKNNEQQHEGGENKKKENGGGKDSIVTVVLKADLHCQGCISKVLKCIRSLNGVNTADIGGEQKITVVGRVDPVKLREKVEQKTHKRIELVSPHSKKDNNNNNKNGDNKENAKGKDNGEGDNGKQEEMKKKESNEKKSKEKEPPVTTAVLKMHLHCEGCIQKICKTVAKTKGYQDVKVDRQKDLVTVTGAMDMKALAEMLKKHLKKDVEILPPKKEVEKKENGGGEKGKGGCEKGKSGGDKGKGGGDKGKSGGGSGGGGGGDGGEMPAGNEKMEGHRMQFQVGHPYPFPYPYPFMYGQGAVDQFYYNPYAYGPYHAPQLFSDENPNACSVM